MALGAVALSIRIRPKDPIAELTDLGWEVHPGAKGETTFGLTDQGEITFRLDDQPRWSRWSESASAFRRLRGPFHVDVSPHVYSFIGIELLRNATISSLNLSGTLVTDLSPLRNLKNLTSLHLRRTQITDLRPLSELKSLKELDLNDTKVSDLRPLSGLNSLSWLELNNTRITDLGPLRNLTSLKTLGLSRTPPVADQQTLEVLQQRGVIIEKY
jgi:Leucine Rich repeats (2 copies)